MSASHGHYTFGMPDGYQDPLGREGIDYSAIHRAMSACYDGCQPCEEQLLAQIMQDAPTAARLVEIACVTMQRVTGRKLSPAVQGLFGGLPTNLYKPDVAGEASQPFRQLARAGLGGHTDRMWAECEQMSPDDRRAAIDTALDLLIGYLSVTHLD